MPKFTVVLRRTREEVYEFTMTAADEELAQSRADEWCEQLANGKRDIPRQWQTEVDSDEWDVEEITEL